MDMDQDDFNANVARQHEAPTLQDAALGVWRCRWWLLLAIVASGGAAFAYSYGLPEIYRAQIVVMPADTVTGGGGLRELSGGLGGLAALVGFGQSSSADVDEALAVLSSREFLAAFIEERGLIKVLFADSYDPTAQRWRVAEEDVPTIGDAFRKFEESVMSVSREPESGTVVIAVEWIDPNLSATWANELVAKLNARMRERAVREGEVSIEYLNREFQGTSLVAIQQAIAALVEEQIGRVMLAKTRDEYTFKIIDRAVAPEYGDFVRPNRAAIAAAAMVITAVLGAVIASFVHVNRSFA